MINKANQQKTLVNSCTIQIFGIPLQTKSEMVRIAQLVRASDCGSEGRGFESLSSPQEHCEGSLAVLFCGISPIATCLAMCLQTTLGSAAFLH